MPGHSDPEGLAQGRVDRRDGQDLTEYLGSRGRTGAASQTASRETLYWKEMGLEIGSMGPRCPSQGRAS